MGLIAWRLVELGAAWVLGYDGSQKSAFFFILILVLDPSLLFARAHANKKKNNFCLFISV
jgi:hypothetical protein